MILLSKRMLPGDNCRDEYYTVCVCGKDFPAVGKA